VTLSLEDRFDIQEHIARRAHASDYPDTDAWVDTFTEDAVLEMPDDVVLELPGGATPMENILRGSDELRAFLDGHLPSMVGLRHWISNIVIEGDGDTATATCMFNLIDTGTGARSVVTGRYINTLKKTAQGWKTSHQKVEMDKRTD
jgi:ketosteroid isomerase-like protein